MSSSDRYKIAPISKKREYIIVGLDPGTTTAVAILGLKGDLLKLLSSRITSLLDVIGLIASFGHPLIVASDVVPTPSFVEKVKRAFDAHLFEMEQSLSIDYKTALARPFGYRNEHERDALAAAIEAFKNYKNKFEQIEKKTPKDMYASEVKALVVRGFSIDSAISTLRDLEEEKDEKDNFGDNEDEEEDDSKILELKEIIKRQEEQINNLKDYIKEIKSELLHKDLDFDNMKMVIDDLKSERYREIQKSREVQINKKEIARLRKELRKKEATNLRLIERINELKHIRTIESSGIVKLVKVVDSFTKDSILKMGREYGIYEGDIIFLADASGGGYATARILIDKSVKAIICGNELPSTVYELFFDSNIPVFSSEEVPVNRVGEFALLDPDILDEKIQHWKEKRDAIMRSRNLELLESLVDEYRTEREKRIISKHL
ncbi:MAG: DUF460 domain-containing protein [Halobacteriota archaeon]|nr:DUF460 domain-containing protein [Halobacteriota archaeon]